MFIWSMLYRIHLWKILLVWMLLVYIFIGVNYGMKSLRRKKKNTVWKIRLIVKVKSMVRVTQNKTFLIPKQAGLSPIFQNCSCSPIGLPRIGKIRSKTKKKFGFWITLNTLLTCTIHFTRHLASSECKCICIYIYIYIYIYRQHFFIDTYLIEHNRHFLSTYFSF